MLARRLLSLLLSVGLLLPFAPLAMPLAQAEDTLPPQTYADGWQLLNAPAPVNRTDEVPGLFSITLKTLPIDPDMASRDVHPLALMLNRYTQVTFSPNLEVVSWPDDISLYGFRRTANIVEQLAPEVHAQYRKEVGFWQRIKNGVTTVLHSVAIIPLSLLCLPLTPMFIGNVIDGSKGRKQTIADKKQDMVLDTIWQNSAAFVERVEALQQKFQPDQQVSSPLALLPFKNQLSFDIKRKQVSYRNLPTELMSVNVEFKQPLAKETLQNALRQGSLPVDTPEDIGVSLTTTYLLEPNSPKPEGVFVKSCQLTYRDQFAHATLWCQGYKQTKTP